MNELHPEDALLRRITPIILRGGLIIAMSCIGLGLLRWVIQPDEFVTQFRAITAGGHPRPFVWREELLSVFRLRSRGLVLLGLVFLTATPLARVLLCAATFIRQRDRKFVILTGTVVALLGVAIVLGRIG
jgi:uncharacterized membrane protein